MGLLPSSFLPSEAEAYDAPAELSDPIGDTSFSPLKGLVHRYPDRVLLKLTHACPVYCRFCFRREQVGPGGDVLSRNDLEAALSYVRNHPEIWEIVLSGGDPMFLPPRRLASLFKQFNDITNVSVVRFHTRVPVVMPESISRDLLTALRFRGAVYVVVHVNHPDELTEAALSALGRFVDDGIPLLSQTVLLKGINDRVEILERLFRLLVANRVKPYYLHHLDHARGTSHFRVPLGVGQEIMRNLRGRLSGLCQPTFMLDIPGGHGKVPVGPSYLTAVGEGYAVLDPNNNVHSYGG